MGTARSGLVIEDLRCGCGPRYDSLRSGTKATRWENRGEPRCDGALTRIEQDLGIAAFAVTYRPAAESYSVSRRQRFEEAGGCRQTNTWTGSLIPTDWDEFGPLRFSYDLKEVNRCGSWSTTRNHTGTGERQ